MTCSRALRRVPIVLLFILASVTSWASELPGPEESSLLTVVVSKENRLSVNAQNVPLKMVLKEIAEKARVEVILMAEGDTPVSARFSALPIEKGVKRLTKGLNHVFLYDRKSPEEPTWEVKSVVILSDTGERRYARFGSLPDTDGAGRRTCWASLGDSNEQTIDRSDAATTVKGEGALAQLPDLSVRHEDDLMRFAAVKALGEAGGEKATDSLIQALADESSRVRVAAVETLGDVGGQKAVDPLIQMLADENATVRLAAVQVLGVVAAEKAKDNLMLMLRDENEQVRAAAAEALNLETSGQEPTDFTEVLGDERIIRSR